MFFDDDKYDWEKIFQEEEKKYDWDNIVKENEKKIGWENIIKEESSIDNSEQSTDFYKIEKNNKKNYIDKDIKENVNTEKKYNNHVSSYINKEIIEQKNIDNNDENNKMKKVNQKDKHEKEIQIFKEDKPDIPKKKINNPIFSFFKNNKFTIPLVVLSVCVIFINNHDKTNSNRIVVDVPKHVETSDVEIENNKEINIYIYNQNTKMLEKIVSYVPDTKKMLEGDYINKIIEYTDYIEDDMLFERAYIINQDDRTILKVILNSNFKKIAKNEDLINGFREAIFRNMIEYYPEIKEVTLEIEGSN